jgi:uncharacterized damage-inducible protein DinB
MREAERIASLLELNFDGEPYYGPSVRGVLKDVDAVTAARRPEGGVHSIWELVGHLTAELRYARALLQGKAESWVAGRTTWPAPPAPSPIAWAEALRELEDANRAFVDAVNRLDDAVLDQDLGQLPRTHYVMLHGMVQHSAYHAGQIVVIARQLRSAP